MIRYLDKYIKQDLAKKMVFLGGPRQVGKTTLSLQLHRTQNYINWDDDEGREMILKREIPADGPLIFDEIHKYRQWRQFLKGLYDKTKITQPREILVTGSARLDFYRYGGDSLQGRYFYYRLHQLSFAELGATSQDDLEGLFKLGGFPEPFLSASARDARRWSRDYRNRLLRDDIIPIENISDLAKMELLLIRLPDLVGSTLSINNLRIDIQVSHKTLSRWLDVLERFYGIFRIAPFGHSVIKSVKKQRKHYHFDWSLIKDNGPRFENMIACHLLKYVHFMQDTQGKEYRLNFFQDIDQREVDFIVCLDNKPVWFIECKYREKGISKHLRYLAKKFPKAKFFQIYLKGKKDYIDKDNIRACSAKVFLGEYLV